jgi:hypothetical protein
MGAMTSIIAPHLGPRPDQRGGWLVAEGDAPLWQYLRPEADSQA